MKYIVGPLEGKKTNDSGVNWNSVELGTKVTVCDTDLSKVTLINGDDKYLGIGSIEATVITRPY